MLAFNPFLPCDEYVPDGEPHVFDGRVYLYGSHDKFGGKAYCENDYVCYSASVDDLSAWRYEGVIYRKAQDPASDKGYLYAPDVTRGADGRYYLYYAMSGDTTISVAVCDTPAGAYEFYGHVRHADGVPFGKKRGDVNNFDPGVLLDDDSRLYLYTGFAPKSERWRAPKEALGLHCDGGYMVELLSSDMLTVCSAPVRTIPGYDAAIGTPYDGHAFFEASSIRKIGGHYQLIYSSILSHELCYALSDSPFGPFTYGGIVVSNADLGLHGNQQPRNYTGNTHGGLAQINSKWYVFYHRQTNRIAYSRQACAEKIAVTPDGHVQQAEITSCGLNGGALPTPGTYEARIACNLSSAHGTYDYGKPNPPDGHPYFTQEGGDREPGTSLPEERQYIANMQDGAWAGFKYFDFRDVRRVTLSLRGSGCGRMVLAQERGGAVCAAVEVTPSADWAAFSADFAGENGVHALYVTYQGSGAVDFRLISLEQEEQS